MTQFLFVGGRSEGWHEVAMSQGLLPAQCEIAGEIYFSAFVTIGATIGPGSVGVTAAIFHLSGLELPEVWKRLALGFGRQVE